MQSADAPSWTPLPVLTPTVPSTFPTWPAESSPAVSVNASASASTGAKTGRNAPRKRLPQEVYDLLTQYYENVNKYPTRPERLVLIARVRQFPGCADYTMDKLQAYFASKRQGENGTRKKKDKPKQPPPSQASQPLGSAQILYPSLATDPAILQNLDVLLDETPEPSEDVAKVWARVLGSGVQPKDITTYADLRRAAKRREAHQPKRLSSQLPTPEPSISPEPKSTPTSPVVETSWGKAPAPALSEVKDELESEDYESEDEDEDELDVKTEEGPESHVELDPRAVRIAEELSKALALPPLRDSSPPPKTFKDLARWFKEQAQASTLVEGPAKTQTRPPTVPIDRKPPSPVPGGRMHA